MTSVLMSILAMLRGAVRSRAALHLEIVGSAITARKISQVAPPRAHGARDLVGSRCPKGRPHGRFRQRRLRRVTQVWSPEHDAHVERDDGVVAYGQIVNIDPDGATQVI